MTLTKTFISVAAAREIDRRAIEDFGIPGIVLMENAARNAADVIEDALRRRKKHRSIGIVCGGGNNGGDGFAIARHLLMRKFRVELFLACDPAKLTGDAATNYRIAQRMRLPTHRFDTVHQVDLNEPRLRGQAAIVDAVLGTGFKGEVRPPLDRVIQAINDSGGIHGYGKGLFKPHLAGPLVVSIDVPSGLDCEKGESSACVVRADVTITFVSPKSGFNGPGAEYVGHVEIVDIGAPIDLILKNPD